MKNNPGEPEMRCRKCGYDLRGLSGLACPECGQRFDPRFRETFLTSPASGVQSLTLSIAAVALFATPLILAVLIESRIEIPIPFWFATPLALISMVGGWTIAWVVLVKAIQALRGSPPWIASRWAFVLSAIIGGAIVAACITMIGGGLVSWLLT